MVELGQLEESHEEFAKRKVQMVVVSNDDQSTAQATQRDFPHLIVVSDAEQNVAKAVQVIHPGAGRHGDDTNSPTTFLIDGNGVVRRMLRPKRFIARFTPAEVLSAIDELQDE